MASLQKLCAWSGSSIVNEAAEVVRRTTTTMGGRTVPLEPRYATMTAQVRVCVHVRDCTCDCTCV